MSDAAELARAIGLIPPVPPDYPEWAQEAAFALGMPLPDFGGYQNPEAERARYMAQLRRLLRTEAHEARREALNLQLRAETLTDIGRRS